MLMRRSIIVQLMVLVFIATLSASAAMMMIALRGPPTRPAPRSLTDVARALEGQAVQRAGGYPLGQRQLMPVLHPEPDQFRRPQLEARLAALTGATPDDVRIYGSEAWSMSNDEVGGPFLAARRSGAGWLVIQTLPDDHAARWLRTTLLAVGLVLLVILALAGVVARRITAPVRDLAAAARRASGTVPLSLDLDRGPPEIRLVARALTDLQARTLAHAHQRLTMLGSIAHDLGTPLMRIAFRAEKLPPAEREAVQEDIATMRAMIADSLTVARPAQGQMEALDLAALCAEIAAHELELGHKVTLDAPHPVPLSGAPLLLRRMVQNLVDNAIRYAGNAKIAATAERGFAVLSVCDDGPGFPDGDAERLLDPFVRGENSRNKETGGTGLGLAIAAQVAEFHRGTITLGNRPQGGAMVVIRLPA